jgi:ABC-2 type transport system permease protein
MTRLLLTIRAFVLRDLALQMSYRLNFVLSLASILVTTAGFRFFSDLVGGDKAQAALDRYGADYFSFAIIGLAISLYFFTGFSSLASAIRSEQTQGTLEALLLTPIKIPMLIAASSAYDFVWASFTSIVYLTASWLLVGLKLQGSFLLAIIFLMLTTGCFATLGIISASFVLVFKRGDPIAFLVGSSSFFLGGVFYPTQMLPGFLQPISAVLPMTHGLDAMRLILLKGYTFSQVLPELRALLLFAAISLPLSLAVFRLALRRAKRDGSLIQY